MRRVELSATAEVEIHAPRLEVFTFLTHNYPDFLDSWLIYPAVLSVEVHADTLAAGVGRSIGLSDGSTLEEEVRLHDPPTVHSYRWRGGLRFPNSMIVAGGSAIWRFQDVEQGTSVEWTYSFELTSPLWWPVAILMMAGYRRWMKRGLAKAQAMLDRSEQDTS